MLCDYYPVLFCIDMVNHVNNRHFSKHLGQKYSYHPKAWIILCMPAANQSLHYNTTQALVVWAHTEWSLQGFRMQCSVVWYLYDSVILNECKSFNARFEDPRSLHTSQFIWSETPYHNQMVIRCIGMKSRCFNWLYQLPWIPYPNPTLQASAMWWLSRS